MDQISVFFTSHSKQTLEMRGLKCADDMKLPPRLIFKSKKMAVLLQKSFKLFQLAVGTNVKRIHGWTRMQLLSETRRFSNLSLQEHQEILFHCLCWFCTNATWCHWWLVQFNSLALKLSTSLVEIPNCVCLLTLESTHH